MSDMNTYILASINDIRIKMMQNGLAEAQGLPAPYPELTAEERQKKVELERQTYMYGYGLSFQDDRELKAFQQGISTF